MKMFSDVDGLFAPMLNALFAAMQGTAVTGGCAPSCTGTNRTVSIAAGEVRVGGAAVSVSAGSVAIDAGGGFARYDLVAVNGSGTLAVTKGTEAQKCPAQPANTCLLAIVSVPAGATVISTGSVLDARLVGLRLADVAVAADKDWAGKSITNIGGLVFARTMHVRGGDPLVIEKTGTATVCSDFSAPGEARIVVSVPGYTYSHWNPVPPRTIALKKNGIAIWSTSQQYTQEGDTQSRYPAGTWTAAAAHSLAAGDVFTVEVSAGGPGTISFYGTVGFQIPSGLIT